MNRGKRLAMVSAFLLIGLVVYAAFPLAAHVDDTKRLIVMARVSTSSSSAVEDFRSFGGRVKSPRGTIGTTAASSCRKK